MNGPRIKFDRTMLWVMSRGYELKHDGHLDLTVPVKRMAVKIGVGHSTLEKLARKSGYRKSRQTISVTPDVLSTDPLDFVAVDDAP